MRLFAEVIVAGVLLFAVFATFAVQVDRAGGYINEAVAIGETRMIISANQTYASANCGLFARTLECLTWQSKSGICIPGYPRAAPDFAGADIARATPYRKSGYERDYTTSDVPDEVPAECDPGSPRFFCYDSRPDHFGLTGERSFVGTTTGDIYVDMDGADTKCVPTDEGVFFEDDSRASIGPPTNARNIEDPPPFSLRRSARRLRGAAILFVPVFLLLVIPYVVFRRRQQMR